MFLSCAEPLPPNVFVVTKTWIEPLVPEQVAGIKADIIDVTTHDTPAGWRRFIPSDILHIQMVDGTVRSLMREEAHLAAEGGGDFWVAEPNPLYDQPLMLEEYMQEVALRDVENSRRAADEDDWDSLDWED